MALGGGKSGGGGKGGMVAGAAETVTVSVLVFSVGFFLSLSLQTLLRNSSAIFS